MDTEQKRWVGAAFLRRDLNMLVLKRSRGDTIEIGDNIVVRVVGVFGSAVKLAIEAPKEMTIHRGEVAAKIRKEKGDSDDQPES